MIKFLKEVVIYIIIGIIFFGALFIFVYFMQKSENESNAKYRAQLIQEFCERSDYDFCEIEKIIYKERENVDNQETVE